MKKNQEEGFWGEIEKEEKMSQKVNPIGFRIGTFKNWKSRWFVDDSSYKELLVEDIKIRKELMDSLRIAGITDVEIERLPKSMVITLSVSRPGVVIGRGGSGIEDLKKKILKIIADTRGQKIKDLKIDLQIQEVKSPDELERRMPHRRSVTRAMERVMQAGAHGVKIVLGGRIGGAEISRVEKYHMGSVPTQSLRENIDYSQVPALLKRGYVGVKVWI